MSNNPPDYSLELTKEEAQFLLKNCDVNITMALSLLMATNNRKTAEHIVEMNERFKSIRTKLKRMGVKDQ